MQAADLILEEEVLPSKLWTGHVSNFSVWNNFLLQVFDQIHKYHVVDKDQIAIDKDPNIMNQILPLT